jgi:hypothetical protein
MPDLGKKYTCYSCHTKFYDLGKPEPLCPKCGADQRDVEEPAEEPEFPDAETPAADSEEEEDIIPEADREEEAEEEEEEY